MNALCRYIIIALVLIVTLGGCERTPTQTTEPIPQREAKATPESPLPPAAPAPRHRAASKALATEGRTSIKSLIERLASPDYGARFDAALRLSVYGSIEPQLKQALTTEAFSSSAYGRAAIEFMRQFRIDPQAPAARSGARARPSVLFISLDTLRADHLGCYGHDRPTSPALDALAARGVLFENAISVSSWTLPAHMSMFTGLYPSFHKLDIGGWPDENTASLVSSIRTLPEALEAAGYTTAGFVAHPYLASEWGFDRGFNIYRRYTTRAEAQTKRAALWLRWHRFHVDRGLADPEFFLFVHYIDPHETYEAPEKYRTKMVRPYKGKLEPKDHFTLTFMADDFKSPEDFRYVNDLYDGEILYVDEQVGELLTTLRKVGLTDETMVIVTSDHGDEFKDHGSMGHKRTLYREVVRVPLLISHPGQIPAGMRVHDAVSLVDLAPTVLDIVGAAPIAEAQGISLRRYLAARPSKAVLSQTRLIFSELGPVDFEWKEPIMPRRAAQNGAHKIIQTYGKDGTVSTELYAVDSDPSEQRELYASHKGREEVQALEQQLTGFVKEGQRFHPDYRANTDVRLPDDVLENLRALGYIE